MNDILLNLKNVLDLSSGLFLLATILCLIVLYYNNQDSQNESLVPIRKFKPYNPLDKHKGTRIKMNYLNDLRK